MRCRMPGAYDACDNIPVCCHFGRFRFIAISSLTLYIPNIFLYSIIFTENGNKTFQEVDKKYNICHLIEFYCKKQQVYKIHTIIGNESVMNILAEYNGTFGKERQTCNNFFVNQSGKALSDQSVRRMINKYTALASIDQHITPHMFRHTFATSLLEADVDIRYIQEMLGHSSINITEIYTHVTVSKQRDILATKHPRKN